MKDLIEIIKGIEGREGKIYWINKLSVSDTVKGKLIIYFNRI